MNVMLNELPLQLRPNTSGLSEDQFKVYKDFSKLSYKSKFDQLPLPGAMQQTESVADNATSAVPKQRPPAHYDFSLDALIGQLLDEKPLDSVTRSLMTIKMDHIKKMGAEAKEEKAALWKFCDSQFHALVNLCDNKQYQQAQLLAEKIRLIVLGLQAEKFDSRLLKENFLEMEEMYILDVEMTCLFLKHKIFPVLEWDEAITKYIEKCPGHLQSKCFEFLSEVVKRCLNSQKLFTHELIPNIIYLLSMVTSKSDQNSEMLKFYVGDVFEHLRGQIPSEVENRLRDYCKKWVEISQIDDQVAQEREINHFFEQLSQLGITKDEELLFLFCKIMVKESIELA